MVLGSKGWTASSSRHMEPNSSPTLAIFAPTTCTLDWALAADFVFAARPLTLLADSKAEVKTLYISPGSAIIQHIEPTVNISPMTTACPCLGIFAFMSHRSVACQLARSVGGCSGISQSSPPVPSAHEEIPLGACRSGLANTVVCPLFSPACRCV